MFVYQRVNPIDQNIYHPSMSLESKRVLEGRIQPLPKGVPNGDTNNHCSKGGSPRELNLCDRTQMLLSQHIIDISMGILGY